MPDFPLIIDSTIRGAFTQCPEKFRQEFIHGLRSTRPSIHLHFGAAFASGCDAFRRVWWGHHGSTDHALAAAFRAIARAWGDEPLENSPPKTFFNCVLGVAFYFLDAYPPADDPIQPYIRPSGMPATEFTFALETEVLHPETADPLIYAGRFDLLGLYHDSLFVVDEKTTKALGTAWSNQWSLRGQFIGYCKAAKAYGYPVAGAIVRGIAFKAAGMETAQAVVPISDWLINRWWEQIQDDLRRMVMLWKIKGPDRHWSQSFDSSCSAYGGCQFQMLCNSSTPENWIEGYFERRVWNPLQRDPEQETKL